MFILSPMFSTSYHIIVIVRATLRSPLTRSLAHLHVRPRPLLCLRSPASSAALPGWEFSDSQWQLDVMGQKYCRALRGSPVLWRGQNGQAGHLGPLGAQVL